MVASPPVPSDALCAQGVTVAFAGLTALRDVSLEVRCGKVLGLIGPNGAGKTTMVNVLTGFQRPSAGHIVLGDQKMNGHAPHTFRHCGISRTFQSGRLFRDLSVLDNLAVTSTALGATRRAAQEEAWELLKLLRISELAERTAGGLPYTDERRVAIARALMRTPRFVLLDEPAAGMTDHEASDLAHSVRDMASSLGCGILLIEHNVRMVLDTCEHIVVLDSGEVIAQGGADAIRNSEVVRHAYMGSAGDAPQGTEAAIA